MSELTDDEFLEDYTSEAEEAFYENVEAQVFSEPISPDKEAK